MSNTKDTPMDYKPLITIAMQEYADQQNASLKLELQKQKELNAELVKSAIDEFVKLDYRSYTLSEIKLVLYSLIKKSSEI